MKTCVWLKAIGNTEAFFSSPYPSSLWLLTWRWDVDYPDFRADCWHVNRHSWSDSSALRTVLSSAFVDGGYLALLFITIQLSQWCLALLMTGQCNEPHYILFPRITICILWPLCLNDSWSALSFNNFWLVCLRLSNPTESPSLFSLPGNLPNPICFFEHIKIVGHDESNDLFLNVCRRPTCAWRTHRMLFFKCFPPLIRCVRQTVSQGPFEAPVTMPADATCRTSKRGFSKWQAEKCITHPAQLQ